MHKYTPYLFRKLGIGYHLSTLIKLERKIVCIGDVAVLEFFFRPENMTKTVLEQHEFLQHLCTQAKHSAMTR